MEGGAGGALVGRATELAALVEAITSDRAVAVLGEAGIGKTSIVRAAAAVAGRTLREGGGFATLSWMPYLAIQRALDRTITGDPSQVAAQVERFVGPELLFIDDLQWADRETRAVVELLAGRVGLVVSVRDGDPGTSVALDLMSGAGVAILRIGGIDRASAMAIARGVRPDLSERALSKVVDRSGGNPLLIEELAVRGRGSSSLARAIAGQLDALDEKEREAIELLSLAGRPLPGDALGRTARRLVELGLARPVGDLFEARHALIAEAVVEGLADDVVRARHDRLARLTADPAEIARHLAAAGRSADAANAALAALDGAHDPRVRAALLVVAATTLEGPAAGPIRIRAAEQLQAIGDDDGAVRLLEPPIDGPDDLRAHRSAVLAESLSRAGRQAEAWNVVEAADALRPDPTSEGAVELALAKATALVNIHGRLSDGIAVLERVAALGPTGGRPYQVRRLLATLRMLAGASGQLGDLERVWSESLEAGDGATAAGTAMNLDMGLLIERGAPAALAFALDAADRLGQLGLAGRGAALRVEATQVAAFAGDLRGSVVLADGLLEEPLGFRPRGRLLCTRGLVLAFLGRFDDAERTLREAETIATPDFEGIGEVHYGRAELAYWSGLPDRAREEAVRAIGLPAVSEANYVLPGLARSWAELELGRRPTPLPEAPSMRVLAGAPAEQRGITALAVDDAPSALAAFEDAADGWAGYHVPHELVCRWAAGEAARRAGLADDAADRLGAALARAVAIGFEPLAARVRRSLRLTGQRVEAPTPGRADRGLLTGREREVVALVGRGLSNVEISRRMGLGRPTVARILSNAMLKLGADSRGQAVALAADLL